MENCVSRLDYLISLKKTKKEGNKLERDEFANNWSYLTELEGFSERAEDFLYNGFTYCGAKPLKEYMKKQGCSREVLDKFFQGKLFGENCASTTQILIHLLALSINDTQKDLEVIASIIKKIPYAIRNKEGKIYGQVDRTVKKYFLDEIKPDAELPDFLLLIENGLDYANATAFAKLLISIIDSMDVTKYSNKCKDNIEKIKVWISPPKQETVVDTVESDIKPTVLEEDNKKDILKEEVPANPEDKETDVEAADSSVDRSSEITEKLLKDLEEALNQKELLEKQLELLNKNNAVLSNKLQAAEIELGDLRIIIVEDNTSINLLKTKCSELQMQLEEALKVNSSQKIEIEQRIELIEMLRRDRSKQGDEAQKRLASKLRPYYEDYLDAEAIEMSVELGENIRDQMGEIFKILSSAGFSIK